MPMAGGRVVDAPVLLLVCFHKALRAELAALHGLALSAPPMRREDVLQLRRRYRFLQVVYKYHCAAEDEVFFQALDLRVKNVAFAYSLEHLAIYEHFDLVFHWLDAILDDSTEYEPFQELGHCAGTVAKFVCQHMLKEEEQVIPMLIEHFSFEEQASLVWQFLCSVPILLLEDSFLWMTSYLPDEEQLDVLHCIEEVVPKDKLLQKMITSWLNKRSLPSYAAHATEETDKVELYLYGLLNFKQFAVSSGSNKDPKEEISCQTKTSSESGIHPIDGLQYWHNAIKRELKEIMQELQEIRRLKVFSTLSATSGRMLFIMDILIYYSDALESVIFPLLKSFTHKPLSFSYHRFPDENQVEELLCALQNFNTKAGKMTGEFLAELMQKLDVLIMKSTEHFFFLESEVFSVISTSWSQEMQLNLLYASIQMMPLGLLKCVIVWLSAQLTEEEAKAVFTGVSLAGPPNNVTFTLLLRKWLSTGYSGKTSLESFRNELQSMYRNRSAYIREQVEEMSVFSPLNIDLRPYKKPHPDQTVTISGENLNVKILLEDSCNLWPSTGFSSDTSDGVDECNTSYSSRIRLQLFFSEATKKVKEEGDASSSVSLNPNPIDHVFLYHRALRNELENLVLQSTEMIDRVEIFRDFHSRFIFVRILFEAHSNAEDEVVFPALEAEGSLINISTSYAIDHKLETEQFIKISSALNNLAKLQASLASERPPGTTTDQLHIRRMYRDMCLELHGMCKSLQITLGHHMDREETELWPKFLEHFSKEEQENLIGSIIGRTKAEVLQSMLPWLMEALTPIERQTLLNSWCKATKNTMFDEWLREWWQDTDKFFVSKVKVDTEAFPKALLSHEEIRLSLSKDAKLSGEHKYELESVVPAKHFGALENENVEKIKRFKSVWPDKAVGESEKNVTHGKVCATKKVEQGEVPDSLEAINDQESILSISEDLEASARKISHDATVVPEEKTRLIQNLIMSRWMVAQLKPDPEVPVSRKSGEIIGHFASYRDRQKQVYGCKHYKRNCKLFASCCNQLVDCRHCHDDVSEHSLDFKSVTKMMCMKCLYIQPVGARCTNSSCGISMAKYFCNICRLFDDEREIYHCPFCNLCRVGKGIGIDYFHCMKCNACMSKSLTVHICREKCFESNCPICFEDIFTSSSPVKALRCGHMMHSLCFQEYTCSQYTCPICSKSLGDMQVYFDMLDALLAEEKIPEEYHGQIQGILCHDCEKRGTAPYHWLYHKCQHCGSYNTRIL